MDSGKLSAPTQPLRRRRYTGAVKTLPALLALALLAGCGGGGGSNSAVITTPTPSPIPAPTPAPTPTPVSGLPAAARSVSAPALANFTATLSENVTSIGVGGTVDYTVILTNTSAIPATVIVDTSSGVNAPQATLHIANSAGQTVYPPVAHPLDGPPPPPGSTAVTVQPGQSIFKTTALAVFTKADDYQAVATFTVAASSTDTVQTVTLSPLPVTVK